MTREELIEAIILERVFKKKGIDWSSSAPVRGTRRVLAPTPYGPMLHPQDVDIPRSMIHRWERGKKAIEMSNNPYSRHYDPEKVNLRAYRRRGSNRLNNRRERKRRMTSIEYIYNPAEPDRPRKSRDMAAHNDYDDLPF